jgi:UDP-N-acetylmuramoyl-tripeptide--D-alanyl-D-alanine ligase
MDYSMDDIARGLESFQPPPMRCQVQRVGRATIINDAYNASPAAMSAALDLLREFETGGRKFAVVGDMRELGSAAPVLHRRLGREVVTRCGADVLVACGQFADDVVAGAREAGMPRATSLACRTLDESVPRLQAEIAAGDVALVKGSRGLAMERLIAALDEQPAMRRAA